MTLCKQGVCALKQQKGAFTIELVFVLAALWSVYLFAADLSYQMLSRAKLDRSSFALVNIIKERSRYFEGDVLTNKNLSVTHADLDDLSQVASRMLNTPPSDIAIKIESLTNKVNAVELTSNHYRKLNCKTDSLLAHADLAPVEKGVAYPLYRVSLCEEQRSWFVLLFNGGESTTVKIGSSSIVPGR